MTPRRTLTVHGHRPVAKGLTIDARPRRHLRYADRGGDQQHARSPRPTPPGQQRRPRRSPGPSPPQDTVKVTAPATNAGATRASPSTSRPRRPTPPPSQALTWSATGLPPGLTISPEHRGHHRARLGRGQYDAVKLTATDATTKVAGIGSRSPSLSPTHVRPSPNPAEPRRRRSARARGPRVPLHRRAEGHRGRRRCPPEPSCRDGDSRPEPGDALRLARPGGHVHRDDQR